MASSALRGVAKRVVALTTRQQGVFLRHSGVMASTAPMLARAHSSSSSSGGDATMKAIVVTEWVNPEAIGDSLVPTTVPAPDIDDGCVKVAVAAAGANFFDILMMAGKYQIKPPLPFVPGAEYAGVVTEVGAGVSEVSVGDRVFGGAGLGCYAESIVVPSDKVVKMPPQMSFEEAAGIFITFPTSYAALALRAKLQPGETCLVHAGAGGVGIVAIQCAKAMGATVVATGGSDEKLKIAKEYGADHVINYRESDWIDAVKDVTDGRGADVIFDPVGLAQESTKCIAWNGRYLVIGFAAGTIPKVAMNRVLLKNISLVGLHWGAYEYNEPEAQQVVWDGIWDLYGKGQLKSVVYPKKYALGDLAAALGDIAARKTYGKVVISVQDVGGSTSKL